jgi:hypothetical protein
MQNEENERIAVLEEKVDQLSDKMDEFSNTLTKYKGFMGGVMFTFSALATALGLFFSYWTSKPQ